MDLQVVCESSACLCVPCDARVDDRGEPLAEALSREQSSRCAGHNCGCILETETAHAPQHLELLSMRELAASLGAAQRSVAALAWPRALADHDEKTTRDRAARNELRDASTRPKISFETLQPRVPG